MIENKKWKKNPVVLLKGSGHRDLFAHSKKGLHYANMSVQYTTIFHGFKNGNFQMKKCDIFLIFAQNIDRGYSLEPPH